MQKANVALPALDPAWLEPSRVVLVGASATKGTLGHALVANLVAGTLQFALHTVNPKPLEIAGAQHFSALADLPPGPGLAIVAIPAQAVPQAIAELGAKGISLAVVISTGLGRDTPAGIRLLALAREAGVRVIGPNSLGMILPHHGLNASFSRTTPGAGPIAGDLAFLSQSGAIATAMLEWAQPRQVGFSAIVSVGDMAQTGMGELIDLFVQERHTRAILLYLEGLHDAAAFMRAAREARGRKPIIALKAGRTRDAGHAALSHTGALAGSWEVYRAAFRECGVVLVETLDAMFDAATLLHRYPEPIGNRLAIVTNGGGAGILAVDALENTGARLAELEADTLDRLDEVLPPTWSRGNPVDIIGDAGRARYEAAIATVIADSNVDAVMVMNCPTALLAPGEAAQATARVVEQCREEGKSKPVFGCWLGDDNFHTSASILQAARIPVLNTPDDASNGFGALLRSSEAFVSAGETALPHDDPSVVAQARALIEAVRADGRQLLSEIEAKRLLAMFGIPVVQTRLVADLDGFDEACNEIEPPYALKIVSHDITHKSDFGGVALGLTDAGSVRRAAKAMKVHISSAFPAARIEGFALQPMVARKAAHELFAGLARDPTFGPIVLFGAGGTAIEVIADKAIGLPPLASEQAGRMIAETRISRLLSGYRHIPATDLAAIEAVLVALSRMALALPEIAELDVNPMLADADGVIALDARVILSGRASPTDVSVSLGNT